MISRVRKWFYSNGTAFRLEMSKGPLPRGLFAIIARLSFERMYVL